MAIEVTTQGSTTTVQLTYSGPKAIVNDILLNASKYWHQHGYAETGADWEDLTLEQKKAILDRAVRGKIIRVARAAHIGTAKSTAIREAKTETDEYEGLG